MNKIHQGNMIPFPNNRNLNITITESSQYRNTFQDKTKINTVELALTTA